MADETKIIRIIIDSSKAVEGSSAATRALAAIEAQTLSTSQAMTKISSAFGEAVGWAKGLVVLAVEEWLRSIATGALKAAAGLEVLSQQLGVSVDFLQAAKSAAAESGMSTDQMEQAFMRFSRTIGTAFEGNKKSIDLFNTMGVYLLDAHGKLRSTEAIFVDFAKAIQGINDPAVKAADMMQAMGRGGARMAPLMEAAARGVDQFNQRAVALGTTVDEHAIAKLHALEVQSEITKLKLSALFANTVAEPLSRELELLRANIEATGSDFKKMADFWSSDNHSIADWVTTNILGPFAGLGAALGAALSGLPALFRALFGEAMNAAIEQVELGINKIILSLNTFGVNNPGIWSRLGLGTSDINPVQIGRVGANNSQAPFGDYLSGIGNAYAAGRAGYVGRNLSNDIYGSMAGPQARGAQGGITYGPSSADARGTGNPSPSGGDPLQNRINKLNNDARVALDGATAAAAAANIGADAVAKLETHTKDLKEVTDAYIKTGVNIKLVYDAQTDSITTNNAAVNKEVALLDSLNEKTRILNNLKTFTLQTKDMQETNAELQLQLTLFGQTTEEIDRQVAQTKALNEERKLGITGATQQERDQIAARTAAIDQQYALKTAIDATKTSQQLWLQPISGALNSLQSETANLFETILTTGKFTWQSLAESIKSIFIKLFAELAAIAVVRPILAPIVQGIFSPGAAQQLGYGAGGSGSGGLASILGPGGGYSPGAQGGSSVMSFPGGGSLFSGGSAGWMGSFGNWLNTPIMGGFSGVSPVGAGMFGPAPNIGGAAGLTPMGAIGGLASIGGGIYSMISGGGSAGSMIGGAAGILGGGISMLGPMLGLGAAAGPIGMGIGLLGAILPSLLGGGGPQIPAMPGLNYSTTNYSPSSARGLIASTGGTPILNRLFSGSVGSGTQHTWDGKQWVGAPYTNATIFSPEGASYAIGGGMGVSPQVAADQVAAKMFQADVNSGAVTGINATLKKIFSTIDLESTKTAADVIDFSKAYDALGKAANPVKDTVDALGVKFAKLAEQADTYSLSLDPIDAEQAKQTKRAAQDFIDNMVDPLAAEFRTLDDEKAAALESAQYIKDNITGVYVDINKITDYYLKKKATLEENYYQGSVAALQTTIDRLTYGDLSNASATTGLAGSRSAYNKTLALARTGDTTALQNLPTYAEAYSKSAMGYYTSSAEYESIRAQIKKELESLVGTLLDPSATGGADLTSLVTTQSGQISDLTDSVSTLVDSMTTVSSQLRSVATNRL